MTKPEMKLKWDTGYWLEEGGHLLPDLQSAKAMAYDLGVECPAIKPVSVIVDYTNPGHKRAWAIRDFSAPYEFDTYDQQKTRESEHKILVALSKLTCEEKVLLGLK